MSLPKQMNYVHLNGFGGPEVLELRHMPTPQPGPGEVLIQVAYAGVNRPDVLQRLGAYPPPPGASDVPGLEVSGVVVQVGEGVEASWVGREVCALVHSGGYAQFCNASVELCLPVPQGLDLKQAAGIPETFFTVWTNVFDRGRLTSGEAFLVHGGSSGIGTTAIQLAKAFGARVFTTVGNEEKAAFCRELGADAAINYHTRDFEEEVLRLTEAQGVDVILDMVAGPYLPKNVRLLALEGRLVLIAFLQGSRAELDFSPLLRKRVTLTGSTLRPRTVAQKAEIAQALKERVWPLLESGVVRPIVHSTYPLDQAAEAHRLMESSTHLGKILLEA
jgi:NADPH2:quinone reductase